jgi:hypothetical protein
MVSLSIILSVFFIGAVAYVISISSGGDKNENYIPDSLEEAAKEAKKRAKRVKEELDDVAKATKEVGKQLKDIPEAVKGKPRKGRKKQTK